jgi:opacity protein-like surface antigen
MTTWLRALLGTAVATSVLAQEAPGQQKEGPANEEGDEGMVEMQKSSGGVLLGLDFVLADVTGNPGDTVGIGLGGEGWAGYEIAIGEVGIVPRLKIGYEKFLQKTTQGIPDSAGLTTVFPGAYVTYHVGAWAPWFGLGLGMGSWSTETGGRESKFAFELGAGVNYKFSDAAFVGAFLGYDIVTMSGGESIKIFMLGVGPQFVF